MISSYCPIPSNDKLQFTDWIEDIKHTNLFNGSGSK